MKEIKLSGLPAVLVICVWAACIAISLFSIGLSIYGIYLAFCASVILGVVTLFVPPASLCFGVIKFFWHVNLPAMIMAWLSAHGGN